MESLSYSGLQWMVRKIRSRFVLKAELGMNRESLVSVGDVFDLRRDGEVRVMCGGEMVSLQEALEEGIGGGSGQSSEEVFSDLSNGVFSKSISKTSVANVAESEAYILVYEESGRPPVYAVAKQGNSDLNLYGTVLQPSLQSGSSPTSIDRYIVTLEKSSSYYKVKIDGKYILPISNGANVTLTTATARAGLFAVQHAASGAGANTFFIKQNDSTAVIKANAAGAVLTGVNDATPSVEERNAWTLYKVSDILSLQAMTDMLQAQAALISSLQSRIQVLEQGGAIDFLANCVNPFTVSGESTVYYRDDRAVILNNGDVIHVDCDDEVGILLVAQEGSSYTVVARADYHQPLVYTNTAASMEVYVATYGQQQSPCHVYVVKA